jgi:hypothetical protein
MVAGEQSKYTPSAAYTAACNNVTPTGNNFACVNSVFWDYKNNQGNVAELKKNYYKQIDWTKTTSLKSFLVMTGYNNTMDIFSTQTESVYNG